MHATATTCHVRSLAFHSEKDAWASAKHGREAEPDDDFAAQQHNARFATNPPPAPLIPVPQATKKKEQARTARAPPASKSPGPRRALNLPAKTPGAAQPTEPLPPLTGPSQTVGDHPSTPTVHPTTPPATETVGDSVGVSKETVGVSPGAEYSPAPPPSESPDTAKAQSDLDLASPEPYRSQAERENDGKTPLGMKARYPVRNRVKVKHLLRCEGDDAQHDHRRLRGNKEPTAARLRYERTQHYL